MEDVGVPVYVFVLRRLSEKEMVDWFAAEFAEDERDSEALIAELPVEPDIVVLAMF